MSYKLVETLKQIRKIKNKISAKRAYEKKQEIARSYDWGGKRTYTGNREERQRLSSPLRPSRQDDSVSNLE